MNTSVWIAIGQIGLLVLALAAVHHPFGAYMARVYTSPRHTRVEKLLYKVVKVDPDADQRWSSYLLSVLGFSAASVLVLFGLARTQHLLPLSIGMEPMDPFGAWNSAVSFTSNTNWQWYSGEESAGHLLQMAGFTVQNFVSAAVGMAVAVALVRGFARSQAGGRIGNFWSDLTRGVLRILLPVAFVAAIILAVGGVIQNFSPHEALTTLEGGTQYALGGPVASQEAIKLLGTNGGGFFNANAAHPFENPTAFTDLLLVFLLLVIPFSLCRTFGLMVGDRKQGFAILGVMGGLWAASVSLLTWAEMHGGGIVPQLVGSAAEGKEMRFGIPASALFAASTTATSTGAVNTMHANLTGPGGGVAVTNILLGEVIPGGVGAGLYGMLVLAVLAVFVAGLMVGRTPEYLGKKIGRGEMTIVSLYVLTTPALVLIGTAVAIALPAGRESLSTGLVDGLAGNTAAHGLTEMLYGFASAANNNGSAFASLDAGTPFLNTALGLAMLFGRFIPIALVLSLAGRLSAARTVPPSAGTLATGTPLFSGMLASIALIVVGLTFVPVLALGPILESLS